MRSLLKELTDDLLSQRLVPALALGCVIGVLIVVIEVSLSAMIFSGPLAPLATRAAGLLLFGAVVMGVLLALTSSFRSTICLPQDAPVAVLAGMGPVVVAAMGMASPEATFMTMVAAMGSATLATGLALAAIGRFRLTNLFRFMPYPVVGGFLAGGGWLLTVGGLSVMSGIDVNFDTMRSMLDASLLVKWGPGALYAIVLWLVLKRWPHFLILPASLLFVTALYYAAFQIAGISLAEARSTGFLLSGVPAHGLWPAFGPADLGMVRWDVVFDQLPIMGAVFLVTLIGLLLNVSGIELGSGIDVDFNKEFRNAGLANIVGAAGGSSPGAHALSLSLLCRMTGAYTRLAGLVAAAVVGAVLFAGGAALEFFPLPVLGGLLVFLGIDIMDTWLCSTYRKLPLPDYLVLGSIFLSICQLGFLKGVGIGLLITTALFIIRFSRVDVIRERFDGTMRHSRASRSIPNRVILQTNGNRLQGYQLTGYLFFGSAARLGEELKAGLAASPSPWCMLLNFSGVSGFDVSSVSAFQRLFESAHKATIPVVIANPPHRFKDMLSRALPPAVLEGIRFAPDLDQGLELCEDMITEKFERTLETQGPAQESLFDVTVDDMLAHLDRQVDFEALVEQLAPWLTERSFEQGDVIVAQGTPYEGMLLIVWGAATSRSVDKSSRLAHYGPGSVVAPRAAFAPCTATERMEADGTCRLAVLTGAARHLLEQQDPALALKLDRYIMDCPS